MGHTVFPRTLTSGLNGIVATKGGFEGGSDKRREGVALGDSLGPK
jgi:gamma-glutamyltranspeptidase